jgi:hypothetical protein
LARQSWHVGTAAIGLGAISVFHQRRFAIPITLRDLQSPRKR